MLKKGRRVYGGIGRTGFRPRQVPELFVSDKVGGPSTRYGCRCGRPSLAPLP